MHHSTPSFEIEGEKQQEVVAAVAVAVVPAAMTEVAVEETTTIHQCKLEPTTAAHAIAAVTEPIAFSFIAYVEQATSAATCLVANSQSLQSWTSQPSQKTMAQTSSVSTAAALLELWLLNSACVQHIVRDRSVFQDSPPSLVPGGIGIE